MTDKKSSFTIGFFLFILLTIPVLRVEFVSAQNNPAALKDITGAIENWRGKNVEMRLRLKYRDHIFERIVFYDTDNSDIEFDISLSSEKKRLAPELVNLHEGMEYYVKFKVKELGALGAILADLESFKPVIMRRLPEPGPESEKAE